MLIICEGISDVSRTRHNILDLTNINTAIFQIENDFWLASLESPGLLVILKTAKLLNAEAKLK